MVELSTWHCCILFQYTNPPLRNEQFLEQLKHLIDFLEQIKSISCLLSSLTLTFNVIVFKLAKRFITFRPFVVPVWRWVSGGARTSAPWWWAGFPQAWLCHPHLRPSPTPQLQCPLPAAQAPTLSPSQPRWRGACTTLDMAIWSHNALGGHQRTWMSEWISLTAVNGSSLFYSFWLTGSPGLTLLQQRELEAESCQGEGKLQFK